VWLAFKLPLCGFVTRPGYVDMAVEPLFPLIVPPLLLHLKWPARHWLIVVVDVWSCVVLCVTEKKSAQTSEGMKVVLIEFLATNRHNDVLLILAWLIKNEPLDKARACAVFAWAKQGW
jgi:hypothetical protein